MKKLRFLLPLIGLMALSGCTNLAPEKASNIEPDNINYEAPAVREVSRPDYEPKDAIAQNPNSVIIHYHNDDKDNANRTFWVWCSGVNGARHDPQEISSDCKDMTLTLDFLGDDSNLANRRGIYFIVKYVDSWTGQSENTYIDFDEFGPDSENNITVWCVPGEGNSIDVFATQAETMMDKVEFATFTGWKTIKVISTIKPTSYKVYAFTKTYYLMNSFVQKNSKEDFLILTGDNPTCSAVTYNSKQCQQFSIVLKNTIHINVQYVVEAVFSTNPTKWQTRRVAFDNLYNTSRFTTYYNYSGNDLGVTYSKEKTTFRVWAPTATMVRLMLYRSGIPEEYSEKAHEQGSDGWGGYTMTYQPGGIWQITLKGEDLNGKYYNYYVVNSLGKNEVVDPYAKACNVSGDRSMVLDFKSTDPTNWDKVPLKWDGVNGYDIKSSNELSVYEIHVRDLTNHESWVGNSKPGTYSAFAESGTRLAADNTIKTGFDHIEELGVKAVQLLPVFDNDNDETDPAFNWGYNPKNYNCVDGGYATDPYHGESRIKEFKNLVMAYANNANHTRVIMDVVYNHVASAPASSFNKLMPKYFFRYAADGTYYNGSGCGNEVKSEAPMMRKYIVESLCWWASEYKIKGFRFDLMGLIDCETLRQAATELYKIDPDIVMYGEGWRGDGDGFHGQGSPADTYNAYHELYATNSRVAVGAFNDTGRNALRGGNDKGWGSSSALPSYGYMQQGPGDCSSETRSKLGDFIWGIHTDKGANPIQTVNYASCHDNWTLFDQLYFTLGREGDWEAPTIKRVCDASTAAHAFVMASNGIAFIQGGEELFRSKELDDAAREEVESSTYEDMYGHYCSHNSYNAPDSVNNFNWNNKISISRDGETVNTRAYTKAFADAIKLHTSMPKFLMKDGQSFPYSTTSAGNPIWGTSWAGSEKGSSDPQTYNGCSGFQLDEYFIFLAGRCWGWIQFGDVPKSSKIYEYGPNEFDNNNGTVNVGNYDADTGGAIVIYKRG